jgi:WhiB family redox-sensing transcriptional regulator
MNGPAGLSNRRIRALLDALGFTGVAGSYWRDDAACAGRDPELFYALGTGPHISTQVRQAKQICAGCPVRQQCLADVMATEDPAQRWGVTGGLSAAERSALFVTRRDARVGEVA